MKRDLFTKLNALLFSISVILIVCWHLVSAQPARSANPPILIATAATAPTLNPAILGGKPVYVLSMTRTGDRVMVRCYPGYLPTIKIQSMGGINAPKEGSMTCTAPS